MEKKFSTQRCRDAELIFFFFSQRFSVSTFQFFLSCIQPKISQTEIGTLFQDGGDDYSYLKNDWRAVSVEQRRGLLRLSIVGNFASAQKIRFIEALGIEKMPSKMRIDGKLVTDIRLDASSRRLRIELENENAKEIALKP